MIFHCCKVPRQPNTLTSGSKTRAFTEATPRRGGQQVLRVVPQR